MKPLFQEYPDDNFHLQVSDEGDSGLLAAAIEENGLATVRWLHEQGSRIDQCNHYDRTPLMEAALWGRHETVRYLTDQGAYWHARDGNNMNSLDLALDTERNTGERASRCRGIYREPANATQQRSEHHLRRLSNAPAQDHSYQDPHRRGFSFFVRTPDGKNLALYRPQSLLLVPNGQPQKAFAELDRGPNYPLVNAMSGYTHPNWQADVLDNNLWAGRANDLRKYLGLSRNIGLALHVEPQLLAWLLFHNDLVKITGQDEEKGDLQDLVKGLLLFKLTPMVTVNKTDFCGSCRLFFKSFRDTSRLLPVRFRFVGEDPSIGPVRLRP